MADGDDAPSRKLQVANARPEDSGRGLAHIPRSVMARLGIGEGDIIEIVGKTTTPARAVAPYPEDEGLELIRKLGRFVEFSVFGEDATVDWSIIGDRKELDVRGAHLGPYCYPVAIDLLARGLVTSKGIVTHDFALEDWNDAIRVAKSPESIKVLLKPAR